eukprot:g79652.t1
MNVTGNGFRVLAQLPQLRQLRVALSQGVTDDTLEDLKGLRSLRELSLLGSFGLGGETPLPDLPHLQKLDLRRCTALTDDILLLGLRSLRELDFFLCSHLVHLVIVRELPNLEKLNLGYLSSCTLITDQGLRYLGGLRSLQKLSLFGCTLLTYEGVRCLVERLENLEELNVQNCTGLTDEHLQPLSSLVAGKNLTYFRAVLATVGARPCWRGGPLRAGTRRRSLLSSPPSSPRPPHARSRQGTVVLPPVPFPARPGQLAWLPRPRPKYYKAQGMAGRTSQRSGNSLGFPAGAWHHLRKFLGWFPALGSVSPELRRFLNQPEAWAGFRCAELRLLTEAEVHAFLAWPGQVWSRASVQVTRLKLSRAGLRACGQRCLPGLVVDELVLTSSEGYGGDAREIGGFGDREMQALVGVFPETRQLNLRGQDQLTEAGLAHLSTLRNLQELGIAKCGKITPDWLTHVATLQSLQRLDLGYLQVTGHGLRVLANLPQLRQLRVAGSGGVTDQTIEDLQGLHSLRDLSLTGSFRLRGRTPLPPLPELQKLDLRVCTALTNDLLLTGLSSLREVNFSWCSNLVELVVVPALPNLQKLSLDACRRVGDNTLQSLAGLHSLQELSLSDCVRLTNQGLQHLRGLRSLRKLDLWGSCKNSTSRTVPGSLRNTYSSYERHGPVCVYGSSDRGGGGLAPDRPAGLAPGPAGPGRPSPSPRARPGEPLSFVVALKSLTSVRRDPGSPARAGRYDHDHHHPAASSELCTLYHDDDDEHDRAPGAADDDDDHDHDDQRDADDDHDDDDQHDRAPRADDDAHQRDRAPRADDDDHVDQRDRAPRADDDNHVDQRDRAPRADDDDHVDQLGRADDDDDQRDRAPRGRSRPLPCSAPCGRWPPAKCCASLPTPWPPERPSPGAMARSSSGRYPTGCERVFPTAGRYYATTRARLGGWTMHDAEEATRESLVAITSWGGVSLHPAWGSHFRGCRRLTSLPVEPPLGLGEVRSLDHSFAGATSFNSPVVGQWRLPGVTSLRAVFAQASAFNQPLDAWRTDRVTDLSGAFLDATAFNQPLASWDVRRVDNLAATFSGATSFNQPLATCQDLSSWALPPTVLCAHFALGSALAPAHLPETLPLCGCTCVAPAASTASSCASPADSYAGARSLQSTSPSTYAGVAAPTCAAVTLCGLP